MVNSKKGLKVAGAFLGIIFVIISAYFSWQLIIKPTLEVIPLWGSQIISERVNAPNWMISLLGQDLFESWNALIVYLAVLMILLFAFSDIISTFSSFRDTTSWAIAIGLAVIGAMTGVLNNFITLIFGGVASFGALGIALIVLWAVVVAVAVNFFVGWSGMKAMRSAKIDDRAIATATSNMRRGYGILKAAADAVESEEKK